MADPSATCYDDNVGVPFYENTIGFAIISSALAMAWTF